MRILFYTPGNKDTLISTDNDGMPDDWYESLFHSVEEYSTDDTETTKVILRTRKECDSGQCVVSLVLADQYDLDVFCRNQTDAKHFMLTHPVAVEIIRQSVR